MAPRSGAAQVTERYATCAPTRFTCSSYPKHTLSRVPLLHCGTVAPTVSALMLLMAQWPCVCCSVVSRGFTHPHGSHPQSSSSANVSNVSPVRSAVSSSAAAAAREVVTAFDALAVEPHFTVRLSPNVAAAFRTVAGLCLGHDIAQPAVQASRPPRIRQRYRVTAALVTSSTFL
jgi:hypothetical protein